MEQLKLLQERHRQLKKLQFNVDETRGLKIPAEEIRKKQDLTNDLLKTRSLFQDGDVRISILESTTFEKIADNLLKRFTAKPNHEVLTTGNEWVRLLEEIEKYNTSLKEINRKDWTAFKVNIFIGDTPQHIESTVAATDKNKQSLSEYSKNFDDLDFIFKNIPLNQDIAKNITKARLIAKNLKEIKFDRDVPPSIKRFLDDIQDDGFNLDEMTDEIFTWVVANGIVKKYKIVAKH